MQHRYELLLEKASLAGYDHYEISNFAKDREHRSRHNVKYWTDLPYFGFGVSAHSYDGEQRYSNVKSTHDYINRISQGLDPSIEKSKLNDYDQAREAFMLQLRMMDGVDRESFSQAYNIDLVEEYKEELDRLVDAQLLEVNDKTVKLTKRGILYSNEIFILFV
ncbi:MAG: hypothetical protein JNN15_03390 [Blastocatellia bacterium]|nr:hypothetical protein [Blastocatellia bacterium]